MVLTREIDPIRRSAEELGKMRRAGRVVAEMHEVARRVARPGATTADIDRACREVIDRRGAASNFLWYHGYPAVVCTSPNNVIVHGIPGDYRLEEGDILSVDCGAIVDGYHGDAALTLPIGRVSPLAERLIRVTEDALWAGIACMSPGNHLHDIGLAVQTVAEQAGFAVVREYVGHGIGTRLHEEPAVPNYWPGFPGPILRTGMVFAVEPMLNAGSAETLMLDDNWSVVTADGGLSAHFEHTIAVTEDGPEVLTLP